jgi:hypothetical protein
MNSLWIMIVAPLLCIGGQKEEPTLEWRLRYLERKIPEGAKESLDEACDYKKHKKDFKEILSVTVYTSGFKESLAVASSIDGELIFSVIPERHGILKVTTFFRQGQNTPGGIGEIEREEIEKNYGQEIALNGSIAARIDPKKPGQLFKGRAVVFVLIVQKMDGSIAKITKEKTPRPPLDSGDYSPPD